MKYTFLEEKYNNKYKLYEYDQFDDEENDEENEDIDDNFQRDYNKYKDNLYKNYIVDKFVNSCLLTT